MRVKRLTSCERSRQSRLQRRERAGWSMSRDLSGHLRSPSWSPACKFLLMRRQHLRAIRCLRLSSTEPPHASRTTGDGRTRPRLNREECGVNLSRSSSRGQRRTCCCSSCRSLGGLRTCQRQRAPCPWRPCGRCRGSRIRRGR